MGAISANENVSLFDVAIGAAALNTSVATDNLEDISAPLDTSLTHSRVQNPTELSTLNYVGVVAMSVYIIDNGTREQKRK